MSRPYTTVRYIHMYAYWVYWVYWARDPPFSALNLCSGAYDFHKFPKNLFQSITMYFYIFWVDFAVPKTIILIRLIQLRAVDGYASDIGR